MLNTLLIMRQEIYKILRSMGYVIFAFVLPVIAVLILLVVNLVRKDSGGGGGSNSAAPNQFDLAVEGFVDQSGLIRMIPNNIAPGRLLEYENECQAKQALQSGEITAYYLIPSDYIESGQVYYVYPDTRSYLDDGQPWVMDWTLTVNMLDGDSALADRVWNPTRQVNTTSIAPQTQAGMPAGEACSRPGAACETNDLVRYTPSILVAIFYIAFMTSSSMLFNSIATEKENRVIEVLMLSVSPRQLLAGKTLGMGLASLLQTILWLGAIYISFSLGKSTFHLPANFVFPLDILTWSIVFFMGGFGLYASLMAGAGALVPKMKEAGVANFIVMIPLLVGYGFGILAPFTGDAEAPFLVFLSFFPLTSPVVMVMRITNGFVPIWQLLISAGLTFATAYFALRAAASMFQAQNLLSGQAFSLRRYLGALAGRS